MTCTRLMPGDAGSKGGGDNAILRTSDGNNFDSNYDSGHGSTKASGNPCSSSGFEFQFKTKKPISYACIISL